MMERAAMDLRRKKGGKEKKEEKRKKEKKKKNHRNQRARKLGVLQLGHSIWTSQALRRVCLRRCVPSVPRRYCDSAFRMAGRIALTKALRRCHSEPVFSCWRC